MATLSDLSIGFIVGGSVLFASIILGFIVWKIIDSKRHYKSNNSNDHTERSRTEAPPANLEVITHQNDTDSRGRESQYTEIHVDRDYHITTAQESTDSPKVETQSVPTQENTDDSGYCEGQGSADRSEVYARLHETRNLVENVYGGFVDEDSGHGSYRGMNSASANSDGENEHGSAVIPPTGIASTNQTDQFDVKTTPSSEKSAENKDMDYYVGVSQVNIIEVHRPAVYESADGFGKDPYTEREDASDSSVDNDEHAEQDTSL